MKKFLQLLKSDRGPLVLGGLLLLLIAGTAILVPVINHQANKPKYVQGDFSSRICSVSRCENPASWRYSAYGRTDYYCAEHADEGQARYERATTKKKTDKLEDDYGHDRFDAITVAKKVIENQLKSPSTAEFCKSADFTVKCSGSTWTVSGYMDAQNGFGATIRSSFTVTFAFSGSSQYTVGSCVIE